MKPQDLAVEEIVQEPINDEMLDIRDRGNNQETIDNFTKTAPDVEINAAKMATSQAGEQLTVKPQRDDTPEKKDKPFQIDPNTLDPGLGDILNQEVMELGKKALDGMNAPAKPATQKPAQQQASKGR